MTDVAATRTRPRRTLRLTPRTAAVARHRPQLEKCVRRRRARAPPDAGRTPRGTCTRSRCSWARRACERARGSGTPCAQLMVGAQPCGGCVVRAAVHWLRRAGCGRAGCGARGLRRTSRFSRIVRVDRAAPENTRHGKQVRGQVRRRCGADRVCMGDACGSSAKAEADGPEPRQGERAAKLGWRGRCAPLMEPGGLGQLSLVAPPPPRKMIAASATMLADLRDHCDGGVRVHTWD